ncbi:MAG: sigma-54-dependent Fis family transcriptional regulator, partial [Candidatus Electrothrix sp. AUS1_2]|nr:sigma-54-dependent Fis family transcriptional regulator [Candidatus Electrothrix sp. AUS1_2]
KKYSKLLGKEVQTISSYGLEVLMNYNFPGNVRELENIIERGVALEASNTILPESLIISRKDRGGGQKEPLFVGARDEQELFERGMESILLDLETKMIKRALEVAEGSKMRAAELLKVSFRSLRYKTKKYELD